MKSPTEWADGLLKMFDDGRRDIKSGAKSAEKWIPELFDFLDDMREDLASSATGGVKVTPAGDLLSALPKQDSGVQDAAVTVGLRSAFTEVNG